VDAAGGAERRPMRMSKPRPSISHRDLDVICRNQQPAIITLARAYTSMLTGGHFTRREIRQDDQHCLGET